VQPPARRASRWTPSARRSTASRCDRRRWRNLVRGELVMHGYWRNDAETARALQDGWLHTGDIGHHRRDGRIVITDRKKDMIVNDKGDNVSPAEGRRHADAPARNRPGDGLWRQAALPRRPDRARSRMGAGMGARQWEKFALKALQDLPAFRGRRARGGPGQQDLSVIEKVRQFTFADEPSPSTTRK
jgi:long-chain acyl-CoA synthetase